MIFGDVPSSNLDVSAHEMTKELGFVIGQVSDDTHYRIVRGEGDVGVDEGGIVEPPALGGNSIDILKFGGLLGGIFMRLFGRFFFISQYKHSS